MTPDVCIYHANCMDGFTAAWVVQRKFPGVRLFPASYGLDFPDLELIRDKHVLVVDFSYAADVLRHLGQNAASIVVLDHHKSAQAELAAFEVGPIDYTVSPEHGAVLAHFDIEKSGARLAWEYCFPGQRTPKLVEYVEDRDLWRWRLVDSRSINAALGSYDQTLREWDANEVALERTRGFDDLNIEGQAILRQQRKDRAAIIGTTQREMKIGGKRVPVANAPFFLASDIGNQLSEGQPFAATYFDNDKGERIFSLRSQEGGDDVSAIAKGYGGGGHKHAAGFQMPNGWEGDDV